MNQKQALYSVVQSLVQSVSLSQYENEILPFLGIHSLEFVDGYTRARRNRVFLSKKDTRELFEEYLSVMTKV
jgi:hypothetical protein